MRPSSGRSHSAAGGVTARKPLAVRSGDRRAWAAAPSLRSCHRKAAIPVASRKGAFQSRTRDGMKSGSNHAGIAPSVGTTGDSYDNALDESIIGLFKTEVIRRRGPWRGIDDVEFATLTWVAWYNADRLLEPLGYLPPGEFEERFYAQQHEAKMAVLT